MKLREAYQLPEEQQELVNRGMRLAWASLFFLGLIAMLIYLTMGSSQAMKTAWVEDVWSMIPPIVFMIAMRVSPKQPNERYPYGFKRASSIAFLAAATAVTVLGLFMLYESAMALYRVEHPTIGMTTLFGYRIWSGWIMRCPYI